MNTDDESDCAIDLSVRGPGVPTVLTYFLTSLNPTKTSAQKNVPIAETSISGVKEQNVDADASKTKAVTPLPKKRRYVVPQNQTEEKHIIEIGTKQTEIGKDVIPGVQSMHLCDTDKKSREPELTASDKRNVKPAREAEKNLIQQASTSHPSTSQPSTSQPSTSQLSTSHPSTSQPSTSKASTSKALTLKTSTSHPSTSHPSTSHPSTSQPSTSKALTSKASTSKTSTLHPSTSHPSTSHPSTSQPSTSKASTSKAATSKSSTSKASRSKASTSKALTSKASTPKASTSKALTSKASTSKASTSKSSTSKASTSKASTSKASTSTASKSKESTPKAKRKTRSTAISSEVQEEAGQNLPSGKKPSASTSVASSSNICEDSQFWLETVKSKFTSSAYKDLLRQSAFTESQAGVIQNLFHRTARRMYNNFVNSDRIKKTHKCQECVFSVSHQCVSFDFLHVGCPTGDPTIPTLVKPQRTIICLCQFAFFHTHTTMPSRSMTEKTASSELTQPLREADRVVSLRCAFCDTIMMIEHPFHKSADCVLSKWSAIKSNNEKSFHAQVTDHLKDFTPEPPTLEEFYICSNDCCLYFLRCTK